MLKKIILGIVIAAVLSVTAFGAVYAYQKERARTDQNINKESLSFQYEPGSGEDCDGYTSSNHQNCIKEEERIRNNLRLKENEDPDCPGIDGEEHRWQHRYEYENQCAEGKYQECKERERCKSQNGSNNNGRGRR
jgi:hypothetical protein